MVWIAGSFSFLASLLRISLYSFPYLTELPLNSVSFGFSLFLIMCSVSNVVRVLDILRVRGFPFFAVVGYINRWVKSMSFTFRLHSSTGLSPVSRLSCSFADMVLPALAIIICSFSCVGIFIILACFGYDGVLNCMFWYLRNLAYICANLYL